MSKRSHTEDEWFAKHERDLIEDLKRERLRREQRVADALKQEEARKRKELHWMHCPKCGSQMNVEKLDEKIQIETCSVCGGLFFDRGELEGILLSHEAKGFQHRFLSILMASWRTKKVDLNKALEEYRKDQQERAKMLFEKMKDEDARKAKEFHWMHCPKDGSEMKFLDVSLKLQIEECPLCNGIFLDHGEIEVIRALSDEQKEAMRQTILSMGASS